MEEKVNNFLESIGLNKNEIKAYLDLLKYRGSSALEISKRTGIHRSNTYDSIRKLIDMGFVSEMIQEKKKVFIAMKPEKIKDYLSQQKNEVEQALPYLKSITCDKSNGQDEVKIERGVFAAREAIMDLLKYDSEIICYGIPSNSLDILGEWFFDEFHKARIKNKLSLRMVFDEYPKDRIKKINKLNYTEARHAGLNESPNIFLIISGDMVLTIILEEPITTIKLNNNSVANCYKNYFEIIWKKAKVE